MDTRDDQHEESPCCD